MSSFERLPIEIFRYLCSYLHDLYPILRSINRWWRDALAYIIPKDCGYYANYAAMHGYKVYLGEIMLSRAREYFENGYYSLLSFANYTWRNAPNGESVVHFLTELYYYYKRVGVRTLTEVEREKFARFINTVNTVNAIDVVGNIDTHCFLGRLFGRFISKYAQIKWVVEIACCIDNEFILDEVSKLGFSVIGTEPGDACSFEVMRKLHELGCKMTKNTLNAISFGTNVQYSRSYSGFRLMCNYAIENGCKFTDSDFKRAAQRMQKFAISVMFLHGYRPSEEILSAAPTMIQDYVRYLLAEIDGAMSDDQ
jgi:hypothetical protein